ncbi:hypothetical protein BH09BAC3_BH09BAC3_22720 [soil metagenome]
MANERASKPPLTGAGSTMAQASMRCLLDAENVVYAPKKP